MYKIVIIDNDVLWAEQLHSMMKHALNIIGLRECVFYVYTDSLQFLKECVEEEEYFLILMDTDLKKMNGIRTAQKLRAFRRTDTICFISSRNGHYIQFPRKRIKEIREAYRNFDLQRMMS